MTRRELLAALPALQVGRSAVQPNVLFIISDDHGWSDYGFMGHPEVRTPNMDKLASESLLFTRGYVPTSLCRPSLASIMTGLYPHQHRITGNDPPGNAKDAANRARMVEVFRKSTPLTAALATKGYVSHQSGKWWEGQCVCCGFTECMTHGDVARGGRHGDHGLKIGRETMQPIYSFLERHPGKPFFLWYAPFLPHTPHNPPERLLQRYLAPGRPVELSRYWAMIEWLDETVGQLVGYLESKKLLENTVIVYLADNGWIQLQGPHALFDTRAKLSPYDAGTRTPIFVRWPGRIEARRDDTTLVSSIDIAPTILQACGVKPAKPLPGIPLTDRTRLEARKAIYGSIFVHTSISVDNPVKNVKYRWVIRGRHKLIAPYQPNLQLPVWEGQPHQFWADRDELYDVVTDPAEKTDLAGKQPKLAAELKAGLDRWWPVKG